MSERLSAERLEEIRVRTKGGSCAYAAGDCFVVDLLRYIAAQEEEIARLKEDVARMLKDGLCKEDAPCVEWCDMKKQKDAAESELAALKAPVGEGGVAKAIGLLQMLSRGETPKYIDAPKSYSWIADLITRLSAQVAGAREAALEDALEKAAAAAEGVSHAPGYTPPEPPSAHYSLGFDMGRHAAAEAVRALKGQQQ
jgi:hypothetical protein